MSEWKNFCLGDVCNTISETYRRKSERVTLINTSDVLNGKILNHDSVLNKNLKGQFKKTFQKDDILFSEIRPINRRCAFVDFENTQDYIASTKLMVLRANKEEILPRYLYFFLTAENVLQELQHLAETRSGTFPQITFDSELATFPINLPPLETQKKIAAVLSALDDKIELNNAINKNLEEQAQAIYKNMFVNKFKIGSIGDYCKVKSGYAFKSKWWQSKGIRVIKIGSINQDELNLMECSFVSEDKLELASNFVVSAGDLVIAMTGATIGKFTFVPRIDEVLLVNQRVGKFFLGDEPIQRLPFIYCTLKQDSVYSKLRRCIHRRLSKVWI